jgi:hypothetical protein
MTVLGVLQANGHRWLKKKDIAYILHGCECKTSGGDCEHRRPIHTEIRDLTLAGHLIVSDSSRGYRLTDDIEEVEKYIRSLEGRRDSLTERVSALRRAVAGRKADAEQTTWLDAA